jgi:uncharacterized protein
MVWIHVGIDLLWLALDVAWLIFVMRWTRKTSWRVLAGVFIAVQMAEVLNELIGRLSMERVNLSNIPKPIITVIVIWHFFGLITFIVIGAVAAGQRLVHRLRPKTAAQTPAAIVPPAPNPLSRRQFINACATFAPPLLTFGLTGIALGQLDRFRLRRFTLSVPSLPKQLDGLTIAHVSDIHVGEWTHGPILQEIVNAVNALRADLVVITGDLINYELSDLSEAIALVKRMPGRYGQWMVEGNHDMFEDGLEFERRVKASGVPLLLDESTLATVRGYSGAILWPALDGWYWQLPRPRHGVAGAGVDGTTSPGCLPDFSGASSPRFRRCCRSGFATDPDRSYPWRAIDVG